MVNNAKISEADIQPSPGLTVEQLINLSITPDSTNTKYLHAVLHIIADKLNLHDTTIKLDKRTHRILDSYDCLKKFEKPDTYNLTENGEVNLIVPSSADPEDKDKPKTTEKIAKIVKIRKVCPDQEHMVPTNPNENYLSCLETMNGRIQKCEEIMEKTVCYMQKVNGVCVNTVQKMIELLQKSNQFDGDNEDVGPEREGNEEEEDEQRSDVALDMLDTTTDCKNKLDAIAEFLVQFPKSKNFPFAEDSPRQNFVQTEEIDNLRNQNQTHFDMCKYQLDQFEKLYNSRLEVVDNFIVEAKIKICRLDTLVSNILKFTPRCVSRADFEICEARTIKNSAEICQLHKCNASLAVQIEDVDFNVHKIQKHVAEIQEKILLLRKIRDIVQDIEKIQDWQKKTDNEMEVQIERFELLKTIKADAYFVENMDQEKVNRHELQYYVPLDLFKTVQRDLTAGVIEVFEQLIADALYTDEFHVQVHGSLKTKANKSELPVMRKALEGKLRVIANQVNELMVQKTLKSPLHDLRYGGCVPCSDAQTCFEAEQEERTKTNKIKLKNRYCGGSHTQLTTDGKAARAYRGKLMDSTNNNANYIIIKGSDGGMYRIREPPTK